MKKIKGSNPHLVVQSNQFINFRHSLDLNEARVFLSMISQIEQDDEDFKTYRIDIKEFKGMVGLKGHGVHEQLKQVSESLQQKTFKRIEEDGSFLIVGYISSAEFRAGQGFVELAFDPKLKPYLLGLKEAFTQYDIRNILTIRSVYSIRLYELLKQYERIGMREFNLDELKYKLSVDEKYKRYNDFKRNVLEIAKRDLRNTTDIVFDYEEIKEGKSIKRIRFVITSQQPKRVNKLPSIQTAERPEEGQPIIIIPTVNPEIVSLFKLFEAEATTGDIEQFLDGLQYYESALFDVLLYAKEEKKRGVPIKSIYAYVVSGLKSGMGRGLHQKTQEKKSRDDQQKKYEAERRELQGWYDTEYAQYLSEHYEQLGSKATDAVKFAFLDSIREQAKKDPFIKKYYFNGEGKPNHKECRTGLGTAISGQRGETKDGLFISWAADQKKVSVRKKGDTWEKWEEPLF